MVNVSWYYYVTHFCFNSRFLELYKQPSMYNYRGEVLSFAYMITEIELSGNYSWHTPQGGSEVHATYPSGCLRQFKIASGNFVNPAGLFTALRPIKESDGFSIDLVVLGHSLAHRLVACSHLDIGEQ